VFVVRLLEANNKSFNLLGQPLDLGLEAGVLGNSIIEQCSVELCV
jgi:hypothetical protein